MNILRPRFVPCISATLIIMVQSASAGDLTILNQVNHGSRLIYLQLSYMSATKMRVDMLNPDNVIIRRLVNDRVVERDQNSSDLLVQRIISQVSPSSSMIIDFENKSRVWIDHAARQYSEMSPGPRATATDTQSAPADQVSIQKGTSTRRIAGYECISYTCTIGTNSYIFWVAPGLMPSDLRENHISSALGDTGPVWPGLDRRIKEIEGFVLAYEWSSSSTRKKIDVKFEVLALSRQSIPDMTFAIPTGYKKVESSFNR